MPHSGPTPESVTNTQFAQAIFPPKNLHNCYDPPSLPTAPTELLDDILSYLSAGDQHSVLLTSQRFHGIASRQLYRHVEVSHPRSRTFCKTISESRNDYGQYTITLDYSTMCYTDDRCSYVLLCHALPFLRKIRALTLRICPQVSTFIFRVLNQREYLYPQNALTFGENIVTSDFYNDHNLEENGFHNLRELRRVNLHGDMKILSVLNIATLTSIKITDSLDVTDLAYFISACMMGGSNNTRITELALSLHHTLGTRIASTLYCIGDSFPSIEVLWVRATSINALDVSQILTYSPPTMTSLREVYVNDWSIIEPLFFVERQEALQMQQDHITAAFTTKPKLHILRFGTILWSRKVSSTAWDMEERPLTESEISDRSLFQETVPEYPLFWDVEYSSPIPLSSIDTDILSGSTESGDDS